MASQYNASHSTFGVANSGVGNVTINGDINTYGNSVAGSFSEESFEELDPPRESEVFKGREEDIRKLEALFFKKRKRKVVIHGLPGFGKTELAVRFAKHCKETDYANIDKAFWINAETSENLKNLHKTLKKVYKFFENKRCLFIFDNGVSRSSIRQYEPPNVEHFYLLITSHIADWDDDIYQMSLKPLNMQASLDVFRAILGGRYEQDEENIYIKMITFLSNAPLGLIVVAGHLRFKMDACKQKKFDTNHFFGEISRMLNTKVHHCQTSYEKSIYAAMFVVLEKMYKQYFAESEQTRELSMTVLGICTYLSPGHIYIEDIKEIMECSEENTVDECVYLSENFSFIEYYKGHIKIHRLCQRILKLYFDDIKKDYYSICLRWLLRKEYSQNWHENIILMEADNKKETVFEIYQQNVSENHYPYVENLLKLLVQYGCFESCELIFHNTSFEKRKELVDNMKLIHVAVYNNQADVLKLFLKYGDLNVRDSHGETPLYWACWRMNIDIVRILLEKGADVNIQDNKGDTPLHIASWRGDIDIVRMLLKKGADVHALNNECKTPLHIVTGKRTVDIERLLMEKGVDMHAQDNKNDGNTALHCVVLQSKIDLVRMLLEKGANVLVRDSKGNTPLHWASEKGNVDIVRMLLEKGVDIHAQDNEGYTPLHIASWKGEVDIVRMLLLKGANVHVPDSKGSTPLHWASEKGNVDIVRMLLEKGADVHVLDNKGITPLHWASGEGAIDTVRMHLEKGADVHVRDSEGKTPLLWASRKCDIDTVRLLLEKGADLHVRDKEGITPLHWASQHWQGKVDIIQILLEKRADVHVQDNEGKTPLHWASEKGHVDIVRMLLEKGADVQVRDNEGRTPLHISSWRGHIHTVQMLLQKGANVHVLDNEGRTSLDCATFCGHTVIINILQQRMH